MKSNHLYIDIHVLQTVPPSCVNRDDTGSPKTAVYGGVTRARVSSQAWKYAVRKKFREELLAEDEVGHRTRLVIDKVADEIKKIAPKETEAEVLAKMVLTYAGLTSYTKTKGGTEEAAALFFISIPQERALAKLAVENKEKMKTDFAPPKNADDNEKKKWKKEKANFETACEDALNENPSVDAALFGRMLAGKPSLKYDASAQVAHSFSTHEVRNEYDYFAAVDDCKEAAGIPGAGHLDTKEFNSATLYRYAAVNVRELASPKSLGAEKTPAAVRAFAEAFIYSMPSGSQNSYANCTLPDMVYITLHDDQPANFCNAFEKAIPASAEGYIEPSKKRFVEYAKEIYGTCLDKPICAFAYGSGMEPLAEPQPLKAVLSGLEAAVAAQLTESEAK